MLLNVFHKINVILALSLVWHLTLFEVYNSVAVSYMLTHLNEANST